jgi:hypothetical protein
VATLYNAAELIGVPLLCGRQAQEVFTRKLLVGAIGCQHCYLCTFALGTA